MIKASLDDMNMLGNGKQSLCLCQTIQRAKCHEAFETSVTQPTVPMKPPEEKD